ncbi:PIN domain-containing protein [Breznakiellaceae bacterium SP9]
MTKLRLYLDTSVISYLDQRDLPEKMAETHKLWDKIKVGAFDIVISSVTTRELDNCDEKKRNIVYGYLNEIVFTVVSVNEKIMELAERIVDFSILKRKSFDDCQHIAAAIISECDMIVSWNFSHIVNVDTVRGVKAITAMGGYKDILIYPPTILLEGEEK